MRTKKRDLKRVIKYLHESISSKCLECCCCQIKEVILCNILGCPLWDLRPKTAKGLHTLIERLKQKNNQNIEAKT